MNLKDIRLAKKLGPKFFDFLDALSKEQEVFTDLKISIAKRIEEASENEDSEKGISQFNSEVISFWYYAFRFKFAYYVNSVICNNIATEKLDKVTANQIALKILNDNSLEDGKSVCVSIRHYEILAEFYYASYLNSLGQEGFDELSRYMKAKNIDEIDTHILKEYLAADVVTSINTNIFLHYLRLFEKSFQVFSKETGLKISDEDLLKYQVVFTQSFVKRGSESSKTCSREIYKFVMESFIPEQI